MASTSPRRSLKTEDDKGIICSSYTDIHPIQFSYTIDTTQSDDESIRSAIGDLESHSLNWLAGSMLPCGARRLDWDPLDSLHGSPEPDAGTVIRPAFIEEKERTLRPDVFRELGIVGLKSSPDDFVASNHCFPTYNKNDTCTVVMGTLSAYLNPVNSANTVTDEQKEEVERNILYQVMTLMRSGILDDELETLEHARYLSPIITTNLVSSTPQKSILQKAEEASGMSTTISILIIAACFAIIGAVGMVLTMKALFRDEEEQYNSVKSPRGTEPDDDDSMMPQTPGRKMTTVQFASETGEPAASVYVEDKDTPRKSTNLLSEEQQQAKNNRDKGSSSRGSWGTGGDMSTTMRRLIVTKKVPMRRARNGDNINLCSVMEEDEEMPSVRSVGEID